MKQLFLLFALIFTFNAHASSFIRVDAEVVGVEPVLKYQTVHGVANEYREYVKIDVPEIIMVSLKEVQKAYLVLMEAL